MLRNHFRTAWRNLNKSRFYTILNVTGLTVGLAVGILMLLWVRDELSFDRFHRQADNIYRLQNWAGTGTSRQIWTSTVAPIAEMGKKELPEIRESVRTCSYGMFTLFKYKEKTFSEDRTLFADPTLFSVFDFPLIDGDSNNPFPDQNSIVLTESTAKRYFGEENPIGKVLTGKDQTSFKVTGVTRDFPKNSSIQSDLILPLSLMFKTIYQPNPRGKNEHNDFSQFSYETYFVLQPGSNSANLTGKLRDIHLRNKADDTDLEYLLQPLADMHLYHADGTEGGIETIRMFTLIAVLILVIACINYVNLSTARAMLRSKEVSMRKLIGAGNRQLFFQFVVESAVVFSFAALLAFGLMYLLLPLYNQLTGKTLVLDFTDPHLWLTIGITLLATLLASSVYPAILLSSFEPLKVLTGKLSSRMSESGFRKALVVVQFTISVVLIVGTLTIGKQLSYIRNKELGYNKEHVFGVFMGKDLAKHYDAVKDDLLKQTGIRAVTRANANIVHIGQQTGNNHWDGKESGETMFVRPVSLEKDFIPFFKIKILEGAGFTGSPSDSTHFILNETAVKTARIQNPIGKRFKLWDREGTIIGVVKDFHLASMRLKIEPVVFFHQPDDNLFLYVRTDAQNTENAIKAVQNSYSQYERDQPFTYNFLDEVFDSLYKSEQQTGLLFNLFAGIAILISCLGLFGLSTYTAQLRTREIGVRKVLGASVSGIIRLVAKDFVLLVLGAVFVGLPIAWYAMDKWLDAFAYRTDLSAWIFLLGGLMAVAIALITISTQAIKAALMNPVKSLRSE